MNQKIHISQEELTKQRTARATAIAQAGSLAAGLVGEETLPA